MEPICSLSSQVEGTAITHWFLEPETQPEVGEAGYDAGAEILREFFVEQLNKFLSDDLHPHGRKIIEASLDGADVKNYEALSESWGD